MSRYTTQLRYICESLAGYEHSVGLAKVDDVLEKSVDKIFDFSYNYYREDKKRDFEKMILRHFYQEEIGLETYASWKLAFSSWFIENMDYYNKLYEAIETKFNPLDEINVSTTRDTKGNLKSNGTTNTSGNSDSWSLYSETPQGGLEGIKAGRYLTTAQNDTNETSTEETTDRQDEETRNEMITEAGRRTNPSKLIKEYMSAIKSVNTLILNELDKFFMGLCL